MKPSLRALMGAGKGSFASPHKADKFIRSLRDEWEDNANPRKHVPTFAMCTPNYFGVEYEINPWMRGNIGQVKHDLAVKQWQALYQILSTHTSVELIPPVTNLPDMCFTANAGLIHGSTAVLSHFKFTERQKEESYFLNWLREKKYTVHTLPKGIYFEGEGDALFQPNESLLWIGHGMRTDLASHQLVSEMLKTDVCSLHLINPHFYHLDTCFTPLPGKRAIYYPAAFDTGSLKKLRDYFPAERRYEIKEIDANNFACNAIICGDVFICNNASTLLQEKLTSWGFKIITTPLSEFMLAGGAAKCLALSL